MFVAFKTTYSGYFGSGGNLDFRDFLQKKFYNIIYRYRKIDLAKLVPECLPAS